MPRRLRWWIIGTLLVWPGLCAAAWSPPAAAPSYIWQDDTSTAVFGPVRAPATVLLGAGHTRRGGMVSTRLAGINTQAFALQGNAATGQRFMGWQLALPELSRMTVCLTHVQGREEGPLSLASDGVEGQADSVMLEGRLLDDRLSFMAEYCQTRFDDEGSSAADQAWTAKVAGRSARLEWDLSSIYVGPAFKTLDDAASDAGALRYSFNSALRLPSGRLGLALAQSRYPDASGVADTRSGTLSYACGRTAIRTSYRISTRTSDACDQTVHVISLGTDHVQPQWSLSPSCSLRRSSDPGDPVDRKAVVLRMAGAIKPSARLSIAPLIMHARHPGGGEESARVDGIVHLVPDRVDLKAGLSYLRNRAKDPGADASHIGAAGELKWVWPGGAQSMGVRGELRSIEQEHRASDWSVSAVFQVSPPGAGSARRTLAELW